MGRWLGFILLGIASAGHAICDVQPIGVEHGFDSVTRALGFAHERVGAESVRTDTEFVGTLTRGKDGYTMTFFRGCAGEDGFRLRVGTGQRLIAVWHTHGRPGWLRERFSFEDVKLVQQLGVPMILILPDGRARVLNVRDAQRGGRQRLLRVSGVPGRPLPVP